MASHNLGKITASTCSPLLTGKGDKLLVGGITFCKQIALERLGICEIQNDPFEGNKYTEWGNQFELDAIKTYEEHSFVTVTDMQKGVERGNLACTPDGYVGEDGLVEVKCPYSEKVFFEYLLDSSSFGAQYNDQVQFQMMLTGRKWCDLVAYHPNFYKRNLVVVQVQADPDWVERFTSRYEQAEAVITDIIESVGEE